MPSEFSSVKDKGGGLGGLGGDFGIIEEGSEEEDVGEDEGDEEEWEIRMICNALRDVEAQDATIVIPYVVNNRAAASSFLNPDEITVLAVKYSLILNNKQHSKQHVKMTLKDVNKDINTASFNSIWLRFEMADVSTATLSPLPLHSPLSLLTRVLLRR